MCEGRLLKRLSKSLLSLVVFVVVRGYLDKGAKVRADHTLVVVPEIQKGTKEKSKLCTGCTSARKRALDLPSLHMPGDGAARKRHEPCEKSLPNPTSTGEFDDLLSTGPRRTRRKAGLKPDDGLPPTPSGEARFYGLGSVEKGYPSSRLRGKDGKGVRGPGQKIRSSCYRGAARPAPGDPFLAWRGDQRPSSARDRH